MYSTQYPASLAYSQLQNHPEALPFGVSSNHNFYTLRLEISTTGIPGHVIHIIFASCRYFLTESFALLSILAMVALGYHA
jgi:hypothetical protein